MPDTARVLVVEPDRDLQDLLATLIDDAGYHVDTVSSGRGMREALDRHDVVIINAQGYRHVDGLALAEHAAGHGAAVIMIPDHSHDRRAIGRGGYLTLSKPFSLDDLVRVLDQALKQKAAM